jgi:magnesium transporter
MNIVQPTPYDVEYLRKAHPEIHPLHLEDVLSPMERPKIDDQDDYVFLVMHFPYWDPVLRLSRPREVDIIVGRRYLITVHDGTLKPINDLFDGAKHDQDVLHRLMGKGASHAFYEIIDLNIREIEENVFTANPRVIIRDIALIRRDVIALRRIIRQQVPILENLERRERPIIQEEMEDYFGDIADHMYRARDIIDENAEVIASLAETADALVSNRINDVMRILTVISVIMLPLTLISSIYGMNIGLPLQEHPQAFLFVNGMMIGIVVLMLAFFRFRNWL